METLLLFTALAVAAIILGLLPMLIPIAIGLLLTADEGPWRFETGEIDRDLHLGEFGGKLARRGRRSSTLNPLLLREQSRAAPQVPAVGPQRPNEETTPAAF